MKWVDGYLLQAKPLNCTALELYAARCGLLHTLSPDSGLSYEGKVRRICYAWGTGNVEKLRRAIEFACLSDSFVAIHVNELYEAWRLGMLRFVDELERDSARKAKTYAKASRLFSGFGEDTLQNVPDVPGPESGDA